MNSKRKQHCNKVKHATEEAALIARSKTIATAKKNGNAIACQFRAYKCKFCDGWHLGTNRKKVIWDLVAAEDERIRNLRESTCQKDRK